MSVVQLKKKRLIEASFYPPLSIISSFYRYSKLLKAAQKEKKTKQGFEVTPRNQALNLPRRKPCLDDCATILKPKEKHTLDIQYVFYR